jgi:phage-related protein
VRHVLAPDERPLHWVGSSKEDLLEFPEQVKDDMGNALGIAQCGGTAPMAKPWKGLGPGVLEIVESREGDAYRAVYTVRFQKVVYCMPFRRSRRRVSVPPNGISTLLRSD